VIKEMIKLVKKLPDADSHIFEADGSIYITQEWLCGTFAGRSFKGDTLEEATQKMIDYFHRHINHDSIVGQHITNSGFPDLKRVESYCLSFLEEPQ